MINLIWLVLIVVGAVVSIWQSDGDPEVVTTAIIAGGNEAVQLVNSLIALLAFWSGLMRLAEEAGLTRVLARLIAPVFRRLFPELPPQHPASGAMLLAISANLLGLGNAATPLGLKAMAALQQTNKNPDHPSDAMCTFVVICTTGLTLVPGTVIALRAAAGSAEPTIVVGAAILTTLSATVAGLTADRLLRTHSRPKTPPERRVTHGRRRVC